MVLKFAIVLLGVWAACPAAAAPTRKATSQREELKNVLQRHLDTALYTKFRPMLERGPKNDVQLTPEEARDLKTLFGDLARDLRRERVPVIKP